MSDGKKIVVDWNKISYPHKLTLLQEAGYDVRKFSREFVENFGGFMASRAGFTVPISHSTRKRSQLKSPTRKRMPPRRRQ